AEATHRRVEGGGSRRAQGGVAETEALGHPGDEVLENDVGAARQLDDDLQPLGVLQVDCDRALVAIDRGEAQAHAVLAGAEVAHVVPAARALHLDDVGAEVGQHRGAVGTGDDPGEVEDANALEHHARSRKPSVIALTSGRPVRAIALMRAFISASGREGLRALNFAYSRAVLARSTPATTRCTSPH